MTEEILGIQSVTGKAPAPRQEPAAKLPQLLGQEPTDETQEQSAELQKAALQSVVEHMNRTLEAKSVSVRFSVDEQAGEIVVKVLDDTTGDVIRQLPSEESLRLSARLRDPLGVVFDQRA